MTDGTSACALNRQSHHWVRRTDDVVRHDVSGPEGWLRARGAPGCLTTVSRLSVGGPGTARARGAPEGGGGIR